jgi:hypothetical protein
MLHDTSTSTGKICQFFKIFYFNFSISTRRYDISPIDNELLERKQRISITYRKVRHEPCKCDFPEFCDWDRNGLLAFPKAEKDATLLESKYVSEVIKNLLKFLYRSIFRSTRILLIILTAHDSPCGRRLQIS